MFDPAHEVAAGEGITFTCEYDNPTDLRVRFGKRAADEMCFVFGFIYPASDELIRLDVTGCSVEADGG